MKIELQKQLHEAELENLRAVEKVKQLKAQIEEANKEPSIFELMPIGSVWCGWRVVGHNTSVSAQCPIKIVSIYGDLNWPFMEELYKLIAEQRRLDAMKKAADAVLKHLKSGFGLTPWLQNKCDDYKNIIEQETKRAA